MDLQVDFTKGSSTAEGGRGHASSVDSEILNVTKNKLSLLIMTLVRLFYARF